MSLIAIKKKKTLNAYTFTELYLKTQFITSLELYRYSMIYR